MDKSDFTNKHISDSNRAIPNHSSFSALETNAKSKNYLIIGAGLLGVQLARQIKLKNPQARVVVIDKNEAAFGETSSQHSALIHHEAYYQDPQIKAWVRQGREELIRYCRKNEIALSSKVAIIKRADIYEELEVPVVSINDFNKALFEESIALGVEYKFNTLFEDDFQGYKLINCAGIGALRIAKKAGLAPSLFQLPFFQTHLIEQNYHKAEHFFGEIERFDIPMMTPHWIHSPFEQVVKYGPFLRPYPLIEYLSSPIKSVNGFIILAKTFGIKKLVNTLINSLRTKKDSAIPYPKRPTRNLIFCLDRLELLNTPIVLSSSDKQSLHILNYHSPGFTISFAYAKYLLEKFVI